jgi:hypothetical protein
MKTLISAALALSLLSIAGTANAATFYGPMHGPVVTREAVRFAPGRHVWVRGERFSPAFGRFVLVDDWRGFRLPRPALAPIGSVSGMIFCSSAIAMAESST